MSRYVSGEREPVVAKLLEMADAFGCSFEWLATGRGAMRPGEPMTVIDRAKEVAAALGIGADSIAYVLERDRGLEQDVRAWVEGFLVESDRRCRALMARVTPAT
jgi:transcriptional regulator with XRE-family HTH domain